MGRLRIDELCGRPLALTAGDRSIVTRCHVARTLVARTVGLLGTRDLADDEALWIARCGSIHTFGMRHSLAVAFVDSGGTVLRMHPRIGPWRVAVCRGASAAIEARPQTLAGVRVGDRLTLAAPAD